MRDWSVCLNIVLTLCNNGKRCLHGIAVYLACFHHVRTLSKLGFPGTGTYQAILEIDIGFVIHIDSYITKLIGNVTLTDIDDTCAFCIVSRHHQRLLAFIAVFNGPNGMTSVGKILGDGRLPHIGSINIDY